MKRTMLGAALTTAAFLSLASPAQAEDACVCVVVRGVLVTETTTGWQCQATPYYTWEREIPVSGPSVWVGIWVRTPLRGSTP